MSVKEWEINFDPVSKVLSQRYYLVDENMEKTRFLWQSTQSPTHKTYGTQQIKRGNKETYNQESIDDFFQTISLIKKTGSLWEVTGACYKPENYIPPLSRTKNH